MRVGFVLRVLCLTLPIGFAFAEEPGRREIPVFRDANIHFSAESPEKYVGDSLRARDNGRVIIRAVGLPEPEGPVRITALLTVKPIPKEAREVHDRWDRAGNIRLRLPGRPDLEVLRFMTSYGGRTEHEADVTRLAPLLRGACEFAAFVDTWVSPAWRIDFTLRFEPDTASDNAAWAAPLYYTDSFHREGMPEGVETEIDVPEGMKRVVLMYTSTGHCTDGTDEDEFVSKANVISVDGAVVHRFHPWRDDCREYRDRNPYTARWSDGYWSSDYSRSGWCPGVEVLPVEIDLTDHLTPGRHTVRIVIENVRPKNEKGDFGYWRVSAHAVGWDHAPKLWRN
ncbi:MAG: peptide-N-glycosidase F-related protein [Candidatus Eisenbacteria bacterium]